MSKVVYDAFFDPDPLVLARLFDKPVDYVVRCLDFHNIVRLPKFRTAGDDFANFYSDMTAVFDTTPSRTKQEFTDECDINTIMKRFAASGGDMSVLPLTSKTARYGDFTNMPESFHAALNYVKDTEAEFLKLDANLRARFGNDPQQFLDFVSNPDNLDELVSLGLTTPLEAAVATQTAQAAAKGKVSKKPSVSSSNDDFEGEE